MAEIMFTRAFNRRIYLAAAIFACAGLLGMAFGAYALWPSRLDIGYEPEQPIAFSHKLHAGDMQIACLYCHSNAEHGAAATVPDVATCMKCHQQVRSLQEDGSVKPATAALLKHWSDTTPILWNKVYDLADFVYFDHSRHVQSKIDCAECHGDVRSMERIRRGPGLKMVWCLDCHKQPAAADAPARERGLRTRAPIHCNTCHR